jgi:hypothetical protein
MKTPLTARTAKRAARTPAKPSSARSSVRAVNPTRDIKALTRVLLTVRAGGRCRFNGHNKYLFTHALTLTEGNFAQAAHIVAFSVQGPRGKAKPLTAAEINA